MADVIGVQHVFDPEPHCGLVQPTVRSRRKRRRPTRPNPSKRKGQRPRRRGHPQTRCSPKAKRHGRMRESRWKRRRQQLPRSGHAPTVTHGQATGRCTRLGFRRLRHQRKRGPRCCIAGPQFGLLRPRSGRSPIGARPRPLTQAAPRRAPKLLGEDTGATGRPIRRRHSGQFKSGVTMTHDCIHRHQGRP